MIQVEHTVTIMDGQDEYCFHLDKQTKREIKLEGIKMNTAGFANPVYIRWADVPVNVQKQLMESFPDGSTLRLWPHTGSATDLAHKTLRDLKDEKAPLSPFSDPDGYVRDRYRRLFMAVEELTQTQALRIIDECVEYAADE